MRVEREFLRNASHELRTPIAVIRANVELLKRNPNLDYKIAQIARIERASDNMQLLTETLLWLRRDNKCLPELVDVCTKTMVDDSIEDFSYLLKDKKVIVKTEYISKISHVKLPLVLFQIVINNLIRNAFQYTQDGEVIIRVTDSHFVINNTYSHSDASREEQGFGLGLVLVRQICQRMHWDFHWCFEKNKVRAKLALQLK